MADWKKLIAYLDEQDENRVRLTVSEISEIVGELKADSAWFGPTQGRRTDYWRSAYVLPILEEAGWTVDFTDYVKQVVGFCVREKESSESTGDMKLYVPATAGECVVVNRGTAVEPMFHIGRILTFVGEGTPNRKAVVHFEGKTEDTPYSAFTESALGIVAFCRLATSRTPLPKGPLDYSLADLAAPEEWVADEAIDKWIPKKFRKKVREAKSHLRPFDSGKTADELDEELFGVERRQEKISDLNTNAEVDGDEDFDDVLDETVESILANDDWTKVLILDSVIEEMGLLSDNGRPITRQMNWYKALARRRKKGVVEQLAAEYPQALVNWWWDGDEEEQNELREHKLEREFEMHERERDRKKQEEKQAEDIEGLSKQADRWSKRAMADVKQHGLGFADVPVLVTKTSKRQTLAKAASRNKARKALADIHIDTLTYPVTNMLVVLGQTVLFLSKDKAKARGRTPESEALRIMDDEDEGAWVVVPQKQSGGKPLLENGAYRFWVRRKWPAGEMDRIMGSIMGWQVLP